MDYKPETTAWVKVPVELLKRSGISQRAAVLLSVIIDKCKKSASLSAPISAAELVERSGMSRRTVCRALDELRVLELIETDRTGRASTYRLTPGCVELCPKAVKDDHPAAQPAPRPRPQRSGRRGSSAGTATTTATMEEYMALVNRFPEDPLPGQLEFGGDES